MFRYKKILNPTEKPPFGSIIDPTHPLSCDLAGYWLLNEHGGNRAHDLSNAGLHAEPILSSNGIWQPKGVSVPFDKNDAWYFPKPERLSNCEQGSVIVRSRRIGNLGSFVYGYFFSIRQSFQNYGNIVLGLKDYTNYCYPCIGAGIEKKINTAHQISKDYKSHTWVFTFEGGNYTLYIENEYEYTGTYTTGSTAIYEGVIGAAHGSAGKNANSPCNHEIEFVSFHSKKINGKQFLYEPYANILTPEYWFFCDFGAITGDAAITKIRDESAPASESFLKKLAIIKIIQESVSVVETINRKLSISKIHDEQVGAADNQLHFLGLIKILAETVSVIDSIVRTLGIVRTHDDSASASDSFNYLLGLVKIYLETANALESTNKGLILTKIQVEIINVLDGINKKIAIIKVYSEAVNTSDSQLHFSGLLKVYNETVSALDAFARVMGIAKVHNDNVNAIESITKQLWISRVMNEIIAATDNFIKSIFIKKIKTESSAANDTQYKTSGIVKIFNDICSAVESFIKYVRIATGWHETIELNSTMTTTIELNSIMTTTIELTSNFD